MKNQLIKTLSMALAIMLIASFASCQKSPVAQGNENDNQADQSAAIEPGQTPSGIIILRSDISPTAKFYKVEVEGTQMEILAVKAPDGSIRTAFNTCQVCYDSGRGYFKQSGDKLVCQNCGNSFGMDQVEIEAGGCNPWPIFESDKTITTDSIEISYEFLKESKGIFANWKK